MLLTIHAVTGSETYKTLATRMLVNIQNEDKQKILDTTSAVAVLRAIITK
jgi:hypothetical protein